MADCGDVMDLIEDYIWMKNFNVLPDFGGKLDQSARFVAAVNLIDPLWQKMSTRDFNRIPKWPGQQNTL